MKNHSKRRYMQLFHKEKGKLFNLVILVFSVFIIANIVVFSVLTYISRASNNSSYGTLPISSQIQGNVAYDPDVNIKLRGLENIGGTLGLVNSPNRPSDIDPKAPKLCTIFSPARTPSISSLYAIGVFDGIAHGVEPHQPAVVGFQTTPGEVIKSPGTGIFSGGILQSPYNVGQGYEEVVVYADQDSIALHVENSDGMIDGYGIHILGVRVDPSLILLYNSLNSQGRRMLPAVYGSQPIGYAIGGEVKVSIRDTGDFLDPRWKQEWWVGCPAYQIPTPTKIPPVYYPSPSVVIPSIVPSISSVPLNPTYSPVVTVVVVPSGNSDLNNVSPTPISVNTENLVENNSNSGPSFVEGLYANGVGKAKTLTSWLFSSIVSFLTKIAP